MAGILGLRINKVWKPNFKGHNKSLGQYWNSDLMIPEFIFTKRVHTIIPSQDERSLSGDIYFSRRYQKLPKGHVQVNLGNYENKQSYILG